MATTTAAVLAIKIITDTKDAVAGMEGATGKVGKFQGALSKAAIPAAIAGAAIIKFGSDAVDSASRLQQAMGGVDAVFGRNADKVKSWAADAAKTLGLSASDYGELAAQIGAQLKNAGVPMDQLAGKTDKMVSLGADLAATYGGTTREAVEALGSALRGEADPAERYGLALNATRVNAELAAKGQDKLTGVALSQAKAQTILSMATEQSGGAVGQFARESDSAAGSAQIASAQWENAKAALGQGLLPVVTAVTEKLGAMAQWMGENTTATKIIVGIVLSLSVAVFVLIGALKLWAFFTDAATVANLKLMASMLTNPVFLVIAAIVGLGIALVVLYKKSETFRNFVNAMWAGIKVAVLAVWDAIKVAAKVVGQYLKALWGPILKTLKVWWKALQPVVKVVFTIIKTLARAAGVVIRAVFNALKPVFRAAWTVLKVVAKAAFAAVKTYVQVFIAYFKLVFNVIKAVVKTVMAVLRGDWREAFSGIKQIVAAFKQFFVDVFHAMPEPVQRVVEKIKSGLGGAFTWLIGKAKAIGDSLSKPFDLAADAVQSLIGMVESLVSWLGKIKVPDLGGIAGKIGGIIPHAMPPPGAGTRGVAAYGAPSVAGVGARAATGGTGGTGGVTINVTGAIDPEATARQIRRILAGHDRRIGLSA